MKHEVKKVSKIVDELIEFCFLHATETGIELSKAHKLYDTLDITKTMGELKKECSPDEIDAFYKVISVYNKIIQKDFEINRGKRKKKPAPNKVLK